VEGSLTPAGNRRPDPTGHSLVTVLIYVVPDPEIYSVQKFLAVHFS
jgi:hypothetical protein